MIAQTVKQLGLVCALAILMIAAAATDAFATHHRYGQITFRVPNPAQKNVVEFRVEMAFRRSFFPSPIPSKGPPPTQHNVGQITLRNLATNGIVLTRDVILTTLEVYPTDDYFIGVYTFTHTFPNNTPATQYHALFTGCCRISTIVDGNHDAFYNIWTRFTIDTTAAGFANASPVSSALPVRYAIVNRPISLTLPASDPNGDPVTFRLATSAESGLPVTFPQGNPPLSVAPNGVVTWTPSLIGLYAVQFVLTDTRGASTVLDFILQVQPLIGSPPTLRIDGSTTAVTQTIPVGFALSIPITASDPDPVAPIVIGSSALPSGSVTTPSLPAALVPSAHGAQVTSTFRWTPTLADVGPHVMVFSATDNNNQQASNSLTIVVDAAIGLYMSGILRDFTPADTDFGRLDGDNAISLVSTVLGADGQPVFAPTTLQGVPTTATTVQSAASFSNWWTRPGQVHTLGLFNNGPNPNVFSFNSSLFGGAAAPYLTWEAHSFYTYAPGDILQFRAADDLWVFINGILAVDLGGIHAVVRTAMLNVDAMAAALGLTAGGTYRMDIFYAHRGSTHGASLGLETTEVEFCDPLGPLAAAALPTRVGTAVANPDGSTRLINVNQFSAAGAAWTAARLPVAAGFAAEFDFRMSPAATGEGFAFVLQDSGANAMGFAGSGLGYANISGSIAIEFDTHQDPPNLDPAFDQVSVHSRFDLANSAAETASLGSSSSVGAGDLNNGVTQHARVTYTTDPAGNNWLRVYLNDAAVPVVESEITAAQMLQAFPSGLAYVGFTAASSATTPTGLTEISHLEFATVEPSPALTRLVAPPTPQDPDLLGEVVVQARDACGAPLQFGGMFLDAEMTVDGYETPVSITDNLDGTYTLQFTPRVGGEWSLAIASDGIGILNSPFIVPVNPQTPVLSVSGGTFPYTGLAQTATGSATGVFGEDLGPLTFTYNGVDAAVDAGEYMVIGSFTGTAHYASAVETAAVPLIITAVQPTIHVNDLVLVYNRQPQAAAWTATGVNGELLDALSFTYDGSSTPPTNAGTYEVVGSYSGSTNYTTHSATGSLTIGKATPAVHVMDAMYTYDGMAHPAVGSVSGVDDEDLGTSVDVRYAPGPGAPVNAGTYEATGTYGGNGNYIPAVGIGTITIERATPEVHVDALTFTYSATSHEATGAVIGVNGENLGMPAFDYSPGGTPPIDAGSYDVMASYGGSGNYTPATGTGTLTIERATPTVQVDDLSFTYSATPQVATGSVTGVNGEDLGAPTTFQYSPGGSAPVDAGTYDVLASYIGSANYTPATGTGLLTINEATPDVQVDTLVFTYDAQPHVATGTVTGIGGEMLGPLTFTYNSAVEAPVNAATYAVVGSFPGGGNYGAATGEGTLTILKARPTLSWATPASIVYGVALSGAQLNASASTPGAFTYAPATGTVLNAGLAMLAVAFAPADAVNYEPAAAAVGLVVTPAPLTISADDKTMLKGTAVPTLTATYTGLVNNDASASLDAPLTLTTTATSASPPGAYPIVASGAADANYAITMLNGTLTVLSSRGEIASVRDTLGSLAAGADPATRAILMRALGRINDSLDPSLWADATHLTARGQKAFEDLRQAIGELLKIANPSPGVASAINRLLGVARRLAADAIIEAQASATTVNKIVQAQQFLADGDARRRAGDAAAAMQRYRQAWQQVN